MSKNKTEVKTGGSQPMTGDISQTLKYIDEREKNLARYSDKLRENLMKIEKVFGNHTCRICRGGKSYLAHFQYSDRRDHNGYNEIPKTHSQGKPKLVDLDYDIGSWGDCKGSIYFTKTKNQHKYVESVFVSIDIVDTEILHEVENDGYGPTTYRVAMHNSKLCVRKTDEYSNPEYLPFDSISRFLLKKMVSSGRLSVYMEKVAEELERTSREYESVSEIAERMAKAIL